MPSVLSYTNAFPGISAPQHKSGQTNVRSYLYPGALQPQQTGPAVLSYNNALLGINMPQHSSGKTSVRGYVYPGALQPLQVTSTTVQRRTLDNLGTRAGSRHIRVA